MKPHPHHKKILELIHHHSGKPTQHTFLNNYLGTSHPRYAISIPVLRTIAREWMKSHRTLSASEFQELLTSLIHGSSSTEKTMAGLLLDLATEAQQQFDPRVFNDWLDHLEGWAEVDAVCTGAYAKAQLPANFAQWKKLLAAFSKSKNIHKRRASLVLLCSPLRTAKNLSLVAAALENVNRLRGEKEILITKAISWVLRNACIWHKELILKYVNSNEDKLPKIAVRETLAKITTGRKTKPKQ